jgi:hypothetical protein
MSSEIMYRKVIGINQTSKTRPLVIHPTPTNVRVICNGKELLNISRIEFDSLTVNEIVSRWETVTPQGENT